jgi:hypothetical protein
VVTEVIESGLPLLIAVPWRNIESWREFAGPLSCELVLGDRPQDLTRAVVMRFSARQGYGGDGLTPIRGA